MLPGADPSGTYAAAPPLLRPVMVFIRNKTADCCPVPPKLAAATGSRDDAEVVFNAPLGRYSMAS
ncbi:hypothetical protein DMH17_09450 [Raoultella planticola]|nr:hypothetical protein [Raoultella planticola]